MSGIVFVVMKLFPFNYNSLAVGPHHISNFKFFPPAPCKVFFNAFDSKKDIVNEFKSISAVYLFHNNINGHQYIGSSKSVDARFLEYFYITSTLFKLNKINSLIYQAVHKYNLSNFGFAILVSLGNSSSTPTLFF